LNNRLRELAMQLIQATKAFEIRDVDGGEEPFRYSSGNRGPLFLSVKGTVSFPFFKDLAVELATKVQEVAPRVDFVAGNVTGGVPPSVYVAQELSGMRGRHVPFVYIRDSRKKGGQKEHVTGINKPSIQPGMNALIGEELVNYATTTTNSALLMRSLSFTVTHGMCIVTYDSAPSRAVLTEHKVELISLFTISEVLDLAEESDNKPPHLIAQARAFLAQPTEWMMAHGLSEDALGGTR
jgi:orotate phosphoribosyltransferase